MAKKPPEPKKIPADLTLLSADVKAELKKEAKASLLAEMEQDARDKFFQDEMASLRRGQVPADQIVRIAIDLAEYAPNLMIDGVYYCHGYEYDVPQKTAVVLLEQMQRTWQHQDEIDGRSRFAAYRKPRGTTIGNSHAGTATRGFASGAFVQADIGNDQVSGA